MNRIDADLLAVRERVLKELSQSKTPSIPLTIAQFVRYMRKIAPDLSNQQNIHLFKRFEINLTHVLIPKLVENDLLARNILQIYRSFSKHTALPSLRDTHSDEHEYAKSLNVKQFASEARIEFYENKSDINTVITANIINSTLLNSSQFTFDDYNDMVADGGSQNIHTLLQEIEELKEWKRNFGMAAMAEVQKLQKMVKIYAEDANIQKQEFKFVKKESTDMHSNILRMQSSNELMVEENNILRCNISNTRKLENDIQRSNRKIAKLQKLNTDLLTINKNYASKNEELNDANDRNSQSIANLRQHLLECERESAQKTDYYIQIVLDLQTENERLNKQIAHMVENTEFQKNARLIATRSSTMVIPETNIPNRPRTVRFDDKNKQEIYLNSSSSPSPYFKTSSDREQISLNNTIPPAVTAQSAGSESSFSNADKVQFVVYEENGVNILINSNNVYETNTNARLLTYSDDTKADENQQDSAAQLKIFSSISSEFHSITNTLRSMNEFEKQKMKDELSLELREEIKEELRKEVASKLEEKFQLKKQQMEIDAQIMQQKREKYETNIAELNEKWIKKSQILVNHLEKNQQKYDQLLDKMNSNSNRKSNANVDVEDSSGYCIKCLQQ